MYVDAVCSAESESSEVRISSSEDDWRKFFSITVTDFTEADIFIIDKCKTVASIYRGSPYFLWSIKYSEQNDENGDVIYDSFFRTTLLDNKAEKYQQQVRSIEFREMNKIVFVGDGGEETVLWSR